MKAAVFLAGLAVLGAPLASTPASAAQATWQGFFRIYAKSGTCANYNPVGEHADVRFQPRGLLDNGTNSRLALFTDSYSQSFELANAAFDTTARTVRYVSIWSGAGSPTNLTVKVQFATATANPIALTTTNFVASGTIQNYNWMSGCTVSFRMVTTRTDN